MHKIDLSRFDLNLLITFEALMTERHVGRAAARLHMTQSATSHALGRLRVMLDDQLFVRHPKGIQPTPRAAALAAAVSQVLRDVRSIVAPVAPFDPASLDATFRIGATDHAVLTTLAELAGRLRATAPLVDLRILPIDRTNVAANFDKGVLDFALGSYPQTPHRIVARSLFVDHYVAVARSDHPALRDGFQDAASLTRVDYAMVSLSGDGHSSFDDALTELGLARRVAVTVPHFLAMPFVIARSDLVALLPSRVAERLAASAGLSTFKLPIDTPGIETRLLYARDRHAEPSIVWMKNMLIDAAVE